MTNIYIDGYELSTDGSMEYVTTHNNNIVAHVVELIEYIEITYKGKSSMIIVT